MTAPESTEAELRWSGYAPRLLPAYLRFASDCFGARSHQANPQYPQWLYDENPTPARAAEHFLVGLDGPGRVVACVHKLLMPWRAGGQELVVPSVHDLMAAPAHRNGIGAMLILGAFARHSHALVPGVAAPLTTAYRKLGCEPVTARWYRWILDPVAGAVRLAAGKLLHRAAAPWPLARLGAVASLSSKLRFERGPGAARMAELAAALNGPDDGKAAPRWTADIVRWRFFHPLGPRHLLVSYRRDEVLAVVSLGRHRGTRLARLVELRAAGSEPLRRALQALRIALFALGGDVLMTFSADQELNALLDGIDAPQVPNPVDTWIYHRRRHDHFAPCRFMGGPGDHGFEAI